MFPDSSTSPLAGADGAAQQYSDQQGVGATTVECPLEAAKKQLIEVKVLSDLGASLPGVELILFHTSLGALAGKTGTDGAYQFKGLEAGSYQLSLPQLDQDVWSVKETRALPASAAQASAPASFGAAPAETAEAEQSHEIQQGECVSKIAAFYGFLPEAIWDYPANAALKARCLENMNILPPDETLMIPPSRQKKVDVTAGSHITIQRLGALAQLRIRFLHFDETPRTGVPYLLSLTSRSAIPVADLSGTTDGQGFLDEVVAADIVSATVTLHPGPWPELHEFKIGYTNPIETLSGWKSQLNNLGYHCGDENDELSPQAQAAIREFQHAKRLDETGEMDDVTQAALLEVTKSWT